jgi:glycosyltransferase involved in cell wall biosynthesis
MKISICVPQYNRIRFLLKSLEIIACQDYKDIEVVISDDHSTDDTEERIKALIPVYRYPIIYHRNQQNLGYDANYRQAVSLATGDYCIVIGNDDSIFQPNGISNLVRFLEENDYPDIGFSNFVEASDTSKLISRANKTTVLGSGMETALQYYSCFSFVGGLIYKRSSFLIYNTGKHDGSIYAQMYLGTLMIASGCRLFSIAEPLILKDIESDDRNRISYLDKIARKWKDFRIVDAGLLSVTNVLISAVEDARQFTPAIAYRIIKRIYTVTYPFWIEDYKSNRALVEAVGLMRGLSPRRNYNLKKITFLQKQKIYCYYLGATTLAFLIPSFLFNRLKARLYQYAKRA